MNNPRDDALTEAFEMLARGETEALETVWAQCSRELHSYAFALCGSQDEAYDALGEVMVKLAGGGRKLRRVRKPTGYLFAMVRNAAISRAKRDRRQERVAAEQVGNPGQEPAHAVAVRQAVLDLPQDQREAVALHVWGGLTFQEIGRVTGVSMNTAAGRYRYALPKLRAALGEQSDEG